MDIYGHWLMAWWQTSGTFLFSFLQLRNSRSTSVHFWQLDRPGRLFWGGCIIQQWSTFMLVFSFTEKKMSSNKRSSQSGIMQHLAFLNTKTNSCFLSAGSKHNYRLVSHVCIRTPTHQTPNSFTWIALATCCLLKSLFLITRIYTLWRWNSLPPCVPLV